MDPLSSNGLPVQYLEVFLAADGGFDHGFALGLGQEAQVHEIEALEGQES